MEKITLDLIVSQGIFAVLFVYLLLDTKKDSKEREVKYQETITKNQTIISDLADKINIVEDIKEDVNEIKNKMNGAV